MPVVAIGVAVLADVGAAGALAGGLAAISTVGALEVVGAVGATIGAIGAVTGNKGLSTAGMILGGIGGVGALAASAGLLGADAASSAPLFGSASDAASGADAAGVDAAAAASDVEGAAPLGGAVTVSDLPPATDIVGSLSPSGAAVSAVTGTALPPDVEAAISGDTASATNFGSAAQDAAAQSMLPSGEATTAGLNPAATSAVGSAAPMPAGLVSGLPAQSTPAVATPQTPGAPAVSVTGAPNAAGSASPGVLGTITSFAKNNPLLSYGIVQSAGSFLAGATSTLTPAQVAALNAQAAQNQAAANLSTAQTANIGQPIPVASRSGLLNSPVTGAAA